MKTEMSREEIIAHNAKVNRQMYFTVWAINAFFILAFVGCGIMAVVSIFQGNWNFAGGYGVISFVTNYIFRGLPWPETPADAEKRQYRENLIKSLSHFQRAK